MFTSTTPLTLMHSPDLSSLVTYDPSAATITISGLQRQRVQIFKDARPTCLCWSPDSQDLAIGFVGNVVMVSHTANDFPTLSFGRPRGDESACRILRMAWSADSRLLAAANSDGEIRLLKTGSCRVPRFDNSVHSGLIQALTWSTNGRYLASACSDGMVVLWNVGSGDPLFCWQCPLQVSSLSCTETHVLVKHQNRILQAIPLRPMESGF